MEKANIQRKSFGGRAWEDKLLEVVLMNELIGGVTVPGKLGKCR